MEETISRNPSRKAGARKVTVKETAKAKPEGGPVVDVPNGQQKQVAEFIKTYKHKITEYMTQHFEEIGDKEITEVVREAAECVVLKRSPKVGGAWGEDTSIIEDVIKTVQGPRVSKVEPGDEIVGIDAKEDDGEQEESGTDAQGDTDETQERDETPTALDSEPSRATKPSKAKTKAKPAKKASAKTTVKAKPAAVATKKVAKEKVALKAEKSVRTPTVSADKIKSLKGRDQWLAAARVLKGQKKLWIQTQDIPDVIGHIYDVSQGKAKLKEEGFDGMGEKSYRRNRILGFKETIESFIKSLK